MLTSQLMQEIQHLSLDKKFYVIEETIKFIKRDELNNQMENAVNEMYVEYKTNKDLTAFTDIDF